MLILPDGSIKHATLEAGGEVIDKVVGEWVDTLEPGAERDLSARIRMCANVSHIVERLIAPLMHELLTAQLDLPEEYTGWRWGLATLVVSGSLSHIACHGWRPYLYDEDSEQIHAAMPLKYAPSARQLLAAKERSRTPRSTMRLLSLADPLTPAKLPALPCSLLEQELLGEMSDDKLLLRGSGATRAALLDNLADADVVHLACHGRVGHGLEGSRLELADGSMGFKELWGGGSLSHVSLAVLSACSSGRQDRRVPEETMDVGSLLLALGAPAIVASLWPVDDLAAALFIDQMFRLWWQGQLSAAAAVCASGHWLKELTNRDLLTIAEAQPRWMPHVRHYVRGLSLEVKRFAEPYYWAAFAYFGV